jgi:hypothetical protein
VASQVRNGPCDWEDSGLAGRFIRPDGRAGTLTGFVT